MKLCELSSVETNCYFKQINQGLRENFRFTIDLLKIMLCLYGVVGCCIHQQTTFTLIHILKTTACFLFQIKTSLIWYSPWFCRFACLLFFASENLRLLLLFFFRVSVYEFCCVVYCFRLLCLFPIQHIRLHRRQQCATLVYVNMIFRFFSPLFCLRFFFSRVCFALYIFLSFDSLELQLAGWV